jgi:hypothetical protein
MLAGPWTPSFIALSLMPITAIGAGIQMAKPLCEIDGKIGRASSFLSNPRFYFWPAISFLITFICLVIAYKNLLIVYKSELKRPVNKVLFILMPVIIWPPLLFMINVLESLGRIDC